MLDYRQAAGPVPAGATRARVTITLTPTLTDRNGPDAPQTGYNYATADISQVIGNTKARSASRSPIQKRRTRFTSSTPRTPAIS